LHGSHSRSGFGIGIRGGTPAFLNPRSRSLLRGTILVLGSLPVALHLSHFPQNQPNLLLILPTLLTCAGTIDHIRCMRSRWSFYHGGVLLCIYMDLMLLSMILFLLLYPYASILSGTHA